MEFFDLEVDEINESSNTLTHLVAGAAAGTLEHCGMFPVDTIKTHMQARFGPTPGFFATGRSIVQRSGVRALFRGVSAVAAGAAPTHALSFSLYEAAKKRLSGSEQGTMASGGPLQLLRPLQESLAGILATTVHDACLTPLDAIKQKMQLGAKAYPPSLIGVLRMVLRDEGVRALYAGYTSTLAMNVPYSALYYATYESSKRLARQLLNRDPHEHHPTTHMLAGAVAGLVAGGATTPLDVARTRLQTQCDTHQRYRGLLDTLRLLWNREGPAALLTGARPRMIFHACSAAIMWTTYEYVKFALDGGGGGGGGGGDSAGDADAAAPNAEAAAAANRPQSGPESTPRRG